MTGRTRLLRPYLTRCWASLAGATACTVIVTAAELAQPWPLKLVIDRLLAQPGPFTMGRDEMWFLAVVAGLVLAIALASALAAYRADLWLNRAGERIVHDLRSAVYAHLQRLSLAFHDRRPTGDLVTRVTGDVNAVGVLFSESLASIASAVLLLAGMATITLLLDPVLALATFAVTPLLGLVTVRYTRRVRELARRQRAEEGRIASAAAETLSAMQVVKAFGSEGFEFERVEQLSDTRREIGVEAARTQARFSGLVDVVGAIAAALAIVFGVFRVSAGALTPGDLVVFAAYASRTYKPLREIARQGAKASRALARADRISELLAADHVLEERSGAFAGARAVGTVALEDVSFAYEPGRPALAGLSLHVPAGQHVAVVGESGAGKSTLGALVARLYDPQAGRVTIDGRDARDCSLAWLRDQVGLLQQETVLFDGTVAENIAYATPATRDQIVAAASAAGAHEFVTSLPRGYDTSLGPRGLGLSGGQRQRIGIARVLLRDPAILVLDEPTTGLDAHSEAEVRAGLDALLPGRTTISITHSIAQAQAADCVVVVEGGRVVEDGDPKELLARPGRLRSLARSQGVLPQVASRRRRPAAAFDPALPGLGVLLAPGLAADAIERALGVMAIASISIREVDYRPGKRADVRYALDLGSDQCEIVVSLDSKAARLDPDAEGLAAQVAGRIPAPSPIGIDAETGALVQCLPLDVTLPALAEPVAELSDRLAAAGVRLGPWAGEPERLGYRARRSAVLRLDGHVIKAYSDDAGLTAGARGLEWSWRRRLGAVPLLATLPGLRATVQPALDGAGVPRLDAGASAAEAGTFLRELHDHPGVGLPQQPIESQFDAAAEAAWLVATVAPQLEDRVVSLMRLLSDAAPRNEPARAAHGDFNASQLVRAEASLAVLDFDHLCSAAPALDLASYAANLVGGRDGDLDHARSALAAGLVGYGTTPPGLRWHLAAAITRRAASPFRLWKKSWPERAGLILRDAERVLNEGALP